MKIVIKNGTLDFHTFKYTAEEVNTSTQALVNRYLGDGTFKASPGIPRCILVNTSGVNVKKIKFKANPNALAKAFFIDSLDYNNSTFEYTDINNKSVSATANTEVIANVPTGCNYIGFNACFNKDTEGERAYLPTELTLYIE